MTKQLRTTVTGHLLTLAVAGLALLAAPSTARAAFLDFTVDEGTVPGAFPNIFVADKINGGYSERLSFDGLGGFSATLIADFTAYFSAEGTVPMGNQLGVPPELPFAPFEYGLYALVVATGTVAGGPGTFTFNTSTIDVKLYIDPKLDTTKTLPALGGAAPVVVDASADDYLLLTASSIYFEDNVLKTGVGGFFDIRFDDPTLSTPPGCVAPLCGTSYWPDLPLIGLKATVDGDFDTFAPSGTVTTSGDLSVVFVPEPASLVLLGLGFASVGLMARRRQRTTR